LCAGVERAIEATSWPIRGSCCVRVWKVRTWMLLANDRVQLRLATTWWRLELPINAERTWHRARAERSLGGPAFAPALLRACPYIFLSRRTLSTLIACDLLDHTSSTMPKVGKPISKRTSTRLRNSIQKKSAEKQRKLRKQAKNVRQLFFVKSSRLEY
jgi:hypothetical protein